MAIVYVEPLYAGRRGRDGIERRREYVRVFEVRTDDPFDDPTVAGGTALLPRNGEAYPTDSGAFMVSIDPVQHDGDSTLWTVTCNYSTVLPFSQSRESGSFNPSTGLSVATPSGLDPTAREENPLDRPTVWRGDDEFTSEIVVKDKDGNDILNAAGEAFDPPFRDDSPLTVLVATKNYAIGTWTVDTLDEFKNTVNSDPWYGLAARNARIMRCPWRFLSENGVQFQQVDWHFKLKRGSWNGGANDEGQGWDLRLKNVGYRENVEGVLRTIVDDETGVAPERPSELAADGLALLPENPLTYRTFRRLREKAFSDLNL